MKQLSALLLCVFFVLLCPAHAQAPEQITRYSVLRVNSAESGTGFVIFTEGRKLYMLTAGHVVAGRDPGAPPCSVDFGTQERRMPCKILQAFLPEDGVDLAVLEVDASQVSGAFAAVRLGTSQSLPYQGSKIYTYGYPAGGALRREDGMISGSAGVKLALRGIKPEPGQSGSPVFDTTNNSVIGMLSNRARASEEQFAVEIDQIKFFLTRMTQFRSFMEVVRAPANAVGPLVASDLGPSLTTLFSTAASPERWYERSKRYARFDLDLPLLSSLRTWLGVKRTYVSSRSGKLGMFGYGWSTTVDYRIDLEASTLCQLIVWNPQGVRIALESVLSCAEVRNGLRAQVSRPELLDAPLKTLFEIPDIADRVLPDGGPSYVGGDFDVVRAKFIAGGVEFGIGATKYAFNGRGQLRSIQASGHALTLDYDFKNRLSVIRDGDQGQQYSYNANGQVIKVTFTDGSQYDYRYDESSNLLGVDRLGKPIYEYGYGFGHLMTSFRGEPKVAMALIRYEPGTGFRNSVRRGTNEYRWEFGGDAANGLPTVIQRIVEGDRAATRKYAFDYQARRLDLDIDGIKTSYTLTQCLCLPLKVEDAEGITSYEYDTFGRIISAKTPEGETRQSYDNIVNKINKVEKRQGSEWKTLALATYDEFSNLIEAKGEGQDIVLTYSRGGQIIKVEDKVNGREVRVQYEQVFGKPSIISVGDASITTIYDNDGNIKVVDSKDGPSTAMMVASTFNNLLDAIAPFQDSIRPKTDYDLLTSEPGGCSECVASLQF
jgi:YD repeat-containing protein